MMMTGKAMDSEEALKFLSEDFPIRSLEEILCETVGYYRCGKWVEVTPTARRNGCKTTVPASFYKPKTQPISNIYIQESYALKLFCELPTSRTLRNKTSSLFC